MLFHTVGLELEWKEEFLHKCITIWLSECRIELSYTQPNSGRNFFNHCIVFQAFVATMAEFANNISIHASTIGFPHYSQTMGSTLVSTFPFLQFPPIRRQICVPALCNMSIVISPLTTLNHFATTRPYAKLYYKKLGPFRIIELINLVTFRLTLPPTFRIHNVFHVSLLELYHPSRIPRRQPPLLPLVELSTWEEYKVDRILDSRLRRW